MSRSKYAEWHEDLKQQRRVDKRQAKLDREQDLLELDQQDAGRQRTLSEPGESPHELRPE